MFNPTVSSFTCEIYPESEHALISPKMIKIITISHMNEFHLLLTCLYALLAVSTISLAIKDSYTCKLGYESSTQGPSVLTHIKKKKSKVLVFWHTIWKIFFRCGFLPHSPLLTLSSHTGSLDISLNMTVVLRSSEFLLLLPEMYYSYVLICLFHSLRFHGKVSCEISMIFLVTLIFTHLYLVSFI